MTRVLVVGANGQLGRELQRTRLPEDWTPIYADRTLVDLAGSSVAQQCVALRPRIIINAAAYTAVDKAESEPELAFKINRDGIAALAQAATELDAPLVHVSTDYVFDGEKDAPYVETDAKAPTSIYGRSKAEGEDALAQADIRAAIVRTSWVFSPHRANFVKTMLRLGETQDEISVVADQLGRPTAARELAAACVNFAARLHAGDRAASGAFHFAGGGDATWADFAEAIFEGAAKRGRRPVRVRRITTAEYPTPAKRPRNSRLDTAKFTALSGAAPRPWRDTLAECLDELIA